MARVASASAHDRTIRLRDGRMLGYAEYGVPEGKPLFYFHGHPGSRFEARFLAEQAARAGARLIGIDRPGMGLSSYRRGRRLLDWPDDVAELANQLGLDRFAVVGLSGGGPYALACAYKLPQRLTACGIVAGAGHVSRVLSFLGQWLPWLLLPISGRMFRDEEHAQKSLRRFARNWVKPDQESLLVPGIREIMAASLVEALRPGTSGAAYDGALLARSWGFELADITYPGIFLWHGELDQFVPVAMARAIADGIPGCRVTYFPNEGHISLIVNRAPDILNALS